jgi:hypothetical protein
VIGHEEADDDDTKIAELLHSGDEAPILFEHGASRTRLTVNCQ